MAKVELQFKLAVDAGQFNKIVNGETEVVNTSIQADKLSNEFKTIPTQEFEGSNGMAMFDEGDFDDENIDLRLVFNEADYLDNYEETNAYIEDEENPDEFIWGIVPESGIYPVVITLKNTYTTGTPVIRGIELIGDRESGQYPTEVEVDGVTIKNKRNRIDWAIDFPNPDKNTQTITLRKWKQMYCNAALTLIRVPSGYYSINNFAALNSASSQRQSMASPNELSFGVQYNTGDVNLTDIDDRLAELVMEEKFGNNNVPVNFLINNTIRAKHLTTDTGEYSTDRVFTTQLGDSLSEWDNIQYGGSVISTTEGVKHNLYTILSTIIASALPGKTLTQFLDTNKICAFYGDFTSKISVANYLTLIVLDDFEIETDTLKNVMDKSCEIAQLVVYARPDGTPLITSARPRIFADQRVLVIPEVAQRTMPTKDFFIRNKYTQVTEHLFENAKTDVKTDENVFNYNTFPTGLKALYGSVDTDRYSSAQEGTQHYRYYTFGRVVPQYLVINVTIPKFSNNNKTRITKISAGTDSNGSSHITYSLKGTKYTGTTDLVFNKDADLNENGVLGAVGTNWTIAQQNISSLPTSITYTPTKDTTYYGEITLNINDNSNNAESSTTKQDGKPYIRETSDAFVIEGLQLLSYVEIYTATYQREYHYYNDQAGQTHLSQTFTQKEHGTAYRYKYYTVTISFDGNSYTIDTNELTALYSKEGADGVSIEVTSDNQFMRQNGYATTAYTYNVTGIGKQDVTGVENFNNIYGRGTSSPAVLYSDWEFDEKTGEFTLKGDTYVVSSNPLASNQAIVDTTYYVRNQTLGHRNEILGIWVNSGSELPSYQTIALAISTGGRIMQQIYSPRGDGNKTVTLADMVANNILEDYESGILTAKVEVNALDIRDTEGTVVRTFENGGTYELGDIVRIDDDNDGTPLWTDKDGNPILFQVTGSTINYDGEPYQGLELRQVKLATVKQ